MNEENEIMYVVKNVKDGTYPFIINRNMDHKKPEVVWWFESTGWFDNRLDAVKWKHEIIDTENDYSLDDKLEIIEYKPYDFDLQTTFIWLACRMLKKIYYLNKNEAVKFLESIESKMKELEEQKKK